MRQAQLLTALLCLGSCVLPTAGFASETCSESVETCVKETYEWFHGRGWLGLELESQPSGHYRITRVVEGSPASAAGFEVGEELAALDGIAYGEEGATARLKEHYQARVKPGNRVTYTVVRGEKRRDVEVVLGSVPEEVVECWLGRHLLQEHLSEIMKAAATEP